MCYIISVCLAKVVTVTMVLCSTIQEILVADQGLAQTYAKQVDLE